MLTGLRVLDLTDSRTYLAGRILADLGADVIKIEPPGGDKGRFHNDKTRPGKTSISANWFVLNLGKRSVTLNIEDNDGRTIFKNLTRNADIIIESFRTDYMKNIGLGYDVLRQINPKVILTSITPFGADGPYSKYKGPEIATTAMSGFMFLTGAADRTPLCINFPISYAMASVHAVFSSLIALYSRQNTGFGQSIDVSARECPISTCGYALPTWDLNHILIERAGDLWVRVNLDGEKVTQKVLWPCKDGIVAFMIMGGARGAKSNSNLTKWMDEEGMSDDFLRSIDWFKLDFATMVSQEFNDRLAAAIERFFMAHTKQQLAEEAQTREILLQIAADADDVYNSQQLAERDFWANMVYPGLNMPVRCPGPFARSSIKPLTVASGAPLPGEHNWDIYERELKLSPDELTELEKRKVI